MNITELERYLQNLKINATARSIAEIWGMTEQSYSRKKKMGSEIKYVNIEQLEKRFNISLTGNAIKEETEVINQLTSSNDELFSADFYENIEVSCGGGICTLNETKKQIQLPKELVQNYAGYKKYSVVRAVSDSMTPYIEPKDYLIIEDTKEIENNKVYVFLYGDTLYCKNLSNNIGQLIIRSLNKDYPTRYIEGEDINNIHIIGKVVGIMRNID